MSESDKYDWNPQELPTNPSPAPEVRCTKHAHPTVSSELQCLEAQKQPAPEVLAKLAEVDREAIASTGSTRIVYRRELFAALTRAVKAEKVLETATREAERLTTALREAAAQEQRLDSDEPYCFDGWNADEAYSAGLGDGRRTFAIELLAPRSPEGEG